MREGKFKDCLLEGWARVRRYDKDGILTKTYEGEFMGGKMHGFVERRSGNGLAYLKYEDGKKDTSVGPHYAMSEWKKRLADGWKELRTIPVDEAVRKAREADEARKQQAKPAHTPLSLSPPLYTHPLFPRAVQAEGAGDPAASNPVPAAAAPAPAAGEAETGNGAGVGGGVPLGQTQMHDRRGGRPLPSASAQGNFNTDNIAWEAAASAQAGSAATAAAGNG